MTKRNLIDKCHELLYGTIDMDLNEENKKWLWNNVFKYHPNRKQYNYNDIVRIIPKHNWSYGNKNIAFEVECSDGYIDFWSIGKCINNRPTNTLK